MIKRVELFNTEVVNIDLDTDTYCRVTDRFYPFKLNEENHICIKNRKGRLIPIWRIARGCFNPALTCRYKDGDITNLKRENIFIGRFNKDN